jgi:hypothetical protein
MKDVVYFQTLLKKYPDCFRNSRFILGNPWKDNLYGYLCPDGMRAFIAINNGGPTVEKAKLTLNSKWGFSEEGKWRILQRWPRSDKYFPREGAEVSGGSVSIKVEPWDILLLEAVRP